LLTSSTRRRGPKCDLDQSLPVLLFRIGRYPLHHGTTGAIRSLGRAGVSVYLTTEERWAPATRSRYLTRNFVAPSSGTENPEEILATLRRIGGTISAPSLLVCTDDEAAVFVAEHATELRSNFGLPDVPPTLPRAIASKQFLALQSEALGVSTPRTWAISSLADLEQVHDSTIYPMIVKNSEPWIRLTNPTVAKNTVVNSEVELRSLAEEWVDPIRVVVQEYIPAATSQDWIVHAYVGPDPESTVVFTGVKVRSWPLAAGATSFGRVVRNDELAGLAATVRSVRVPRHRRPLLETRHTRRPLPPFGLQSTNRRPIQAVRDVIWSRCHSRNASRPIRPKPGDRRNA
jgi:D-aspartate ligase